ncbi:MAG: beta-lactamase [Pseudohongiella sp.]|nr:MAG: beta-lactamase [Pseudohongiella sp.]
MPERLLQRVQQVEENLGARLGFAVLDEESGRRWTFQADQRFPMCSTFKVLASAAFLTRVDRGEDSLDRRVVISTDDLVSYSPLTETRTGGQGMIMAEICEAALTLSDNTAGNIILESIGGPAGVTDFARSIEDEVSRLDRWETDLNEALVGDERDTTSPNAIVHSLRELFLGSALSDSSKNQLTQWMVANKTGDAKIRAGLPVTWVVGDKTGGGDNGTMADVAIVWPENRQPLIVAIYMTETSASFDDRNAGIAEIAKALSAAL